MVKAELSYNPYLLETKVRFNGQAPRINSLVEKYDQSMLQTWIKQIPEIFYNEMNGYDFELEFSGPKRDYMELVKAFADAGVNTKDREQVYLFYKNELGGRYSKLTLMNQLLEWLEQNPNEKFDFDAFREADEGIRGGGFPFILLHGSEEDVPVFSEFEVDGELVEDTAELDSTDLTNTPILFYLNAETMDSLQQDLKYFKNRNDVGEEQLFFRIHPALDTDITTRVIVDLGIENPQIVTGSDEPLIKDYFELYPLTDYLYKMVTLSRAKVEKLSEELEEERKAHELANKDIYAKLDTLGSDLNGLKDAYDNIANHDNLDFPSAFSGAKADFVSRMNSWKSKKTKMTRVDEAIHTSQECDNEVHAAYKDFQDRMGELRDTEKASLMKDLNTIYRAAGVDQDYQPQITELGKVNAPEFPLICTDLQNLKEERWVQPKEDILGFFRRGSTESGKEPVLEVTYYYQKWREYALSTAEPLLDLTTLDSFEVLKEFFTALANEYLQHIKELIEEKSAERAETASELSEDEQLLQNDANWLESFKDRLREIGRD